MPPGDWLNRAEETARTLRAPAFVVHAEMDRARVLSRAGSSEAQGLLVSAAQAAERHGLHRLALLAGSALPR